MIKHQLETIDNVIDISDKLVLDDLPLKDIKRVSFDAERVSSYGQLYTIPKESFKGRDIDTCLEDVLVKVKKGVDLFFNNKNNIKGFMPMYYLDYADKPALPCYCFYWLEEDCLKVAVEINILEE